MPNNFNDLRHTATALLASFVVIVMGLLFCTALAFAFSTDPSKPLAVGLGFFGFVALLIWLLREKPRNSLIERKYFWLLKPRRSTRTHHYRLKLAKNPQLEQFGTNAPPTAESVRELSEGLNNWTPKKIRLHD